MDTSNTTPRRILSWLEDDVYGPWRRYLCMGKGTRAWTKRWTHKRERREARGLIEEQFLDE